MKPQPFSIYCEKLPLYVRMTIGETEIMRRDIPPERFQTLQHAEGRVQHVLE
jgi:hypothetical protein